MNARPIRVLFVTSQFKAMGGAEKNILELLRGLDRERFQPYLAVLQEGRLLDDARGEGVPVWHIGIRKIFGWEALRKGIRFMRDLRRAKIDVVVGYHHDADLWGGFFALLAGVPVVISSRRDMGEMLQLKHVWAYRIMNRFYTRIVAVAEAVKGAVSAREWANPAKIVTVYNGVDVAVYRRPVDVARKRRELGVDPYLPTVGMVANFRPIKAQEDFVRAAAQVLQEFPHAQFVIVGYKDTEYYRRVERLMRDLGVIGRVHCVGARDDVAEVLKTFDVFVLSSLGEGFSNAILEAMASGVIVVATRSGGNPEAVIDGKSGSIVEPHDTRGLAEAIKRFLRDTELRRRFAASAQNLLEEKFTHKRMIDRVSALLTSLATT
jgi:glycosyltransferase involved in cell wall biosynthesis